MFREIMEGAIGEPIPYGSDHGPHKCPVCGGKGIVPNGFYSSTGEEWSTTDNSPETCRSCGGGGIVWG